MHLPELDSPLRFLGIFMKVILAQIEALSSIVLWEETYLCISLAGNIWRMPDFIVENVYPQAKLLLSGLFAL